jgi:hypothetical protein
MNKKEIGKEIEVLIRSIKLHYDNIAEEVRIPTIELELITAKIRKLHEKSIIFNHMHMMEELMQKQKALESIDEDDETPEENFIINASEIPTPLSGSPKEQPTEAPVKMPIVEAVPAPAPIAVQEVIVEKTPEPVIEKTIAVEPVVVPPAPVAVESVVVTPTPVVETPVSPAPTVTTSSHSASPTSESNEIVGKDLKKIIGFSDKYFFISQLFGGVADDFNVELNTLNKMPDASKAQAHLQALAAKKSWASDSEAYQALTRYITHKFA